MQTMRYNALYGPKRSLPAVTPARHACANEHPSRMLEHESTTHACSTFDDLGLAMSAHTLQRISAHKAENGDTAKLSTHDQCTICI